MIKRQQQSAGKHAHIPEQSVQPRHAMQQYMGHRNISWLQIKYREQQKLGSIGRFGRTSGFSIVTNEEYVCVWRMEKGRLFQVTGPW